jgi:hypothetical protein
MEEAAPVLWEVTARLHTAISKKLQFSLSAPSEAQTSPVIIIIID